MLDKRLRTSKTVFLRVGALAIAILGWTSPSSALMISVDLSADGNVVPNTSFVAEAQPAGSFGNGNLLDVFRSAASIWERAILDVHSVDIHVAWGSGGRLARDGAIAVTTGVRFDAATGRVTEASIIFDTGRQDRDPSTGQLVCQPPAPPDCAQHYIDPTPLRFDEFGALQQQFTDLGGGPINRARFLDALPGTPAGDRLQAGYGDLLTTSLHEIGHALNVSTNTMWANDTGADGDVDILTGPFAGTEIPYQPLDGGHPALNGMVMCSGIPVCEPLPGDRRIPSALDILLVGTLNNWTNLNFSAVRVPEPPSFILLALGLVIIPLVRRFMSP